MKINLSIDGTDVDQYLTPGTLNLPDAINARSVLTFLLQAPIGTLDLQPGLAVTLTEPIDEYIDYGSIADAVVDSIDCGSVTDAVDVNEDYGNIYSIFSGTVDSIEKYFINPARTWVGYNVSCADNHAIFDHRLVAESAVNVSVGTFITDTLYDEYIEPEGITLGVVDGFDVTIYEAVFSYETLTSVLDKLAAMTGYIWYVNPDKSFHFTKRDSEDAPWSLTESSEIANLLVVDHREQYRNKQYIKDGTAATDTQTETFVADGQQTTFVVAYPILTAPTITVNGSAKTVGIRGIDEGKDFYWNKGKTEVNAATAPTATHVVSVSYVGKFDVIIEYSNITQIEARKAIEGGTGIYEAVESKTGLSTLDALTDLASEKIRQFGAFGKKVSFTTMQTGLQPGQLMPIDLPNLDIDATDMLITDVTLAEIEKPGEYAFTVNAVTGEAVGGWTKFFRDWLNPREPIVMENQSQILAINKVSDKTWVELDFPNIFYTLYPSDALMPAADLYPMFHPDYECRFVEYSLDGAPAGRVERATIERVGDVITTTFVLQSDIVGNITSIAFYGDDLATLEIGSGTLIESESYTQAKTRFDIIQILRTDTKGW